MEHENVYVMLETLKKANFQLNSSCHSKVSMIVLMKIVFGQAKTRELVTVFTPFTSPKPHPPPFPAIAGY